MDIHRRVGEHIGKYDTLLEIVKKRKLRLFGHVVTRLRTKGTPSCRVQFRGKIKRKASRWLDDVNGMDRAELKLYVERECREPRGHGDSMLVVLPKLNE